jgi:hypothetical protein
MRGGNIYMGMTRVMGRRLLIFALVLSAGGLLALGGCKGDTTAPFGSTVTLVETDRLYATTPTFLYTNTLTYRVMVLDPTGLPMSGVDVNLEALITSGQNVNINGVPGNAGDRVLSTLTMNDSGYKDFAIIASDQAFGTVLDLPVATATPIIAGGTLPDGTYYYTVTASDASTPIQETVAASTASAVISSATSSNNSVQISWNQIRGATAYNVYGRVPTVGSEVLLATVPTSTTVWIDKGDSPQDPTRNPPPLGSQPLGTSGNALEIGLRAWTGASSATLDVSLY